MSDVSEGYKKIIKKVFVLLKEQGFAFKKDGANFRFIDNSSFPKVAAVVNFQKSMYGTKDCISFTVNLGVLLAYGNAPIPERIKEYECPIRKRPASGTAKYPYDKWWEITESTDLDALYKELHDLTMEEIIPFFNKYRIQPYM
ncbi:MAG: DUF4304 domain-containing protein [Clostridia bacterium]|nr:DUF4304 domain-containing protein [Clostridia bacterium]